MVLLTPDLAEKRPPLASGFPTTPLGESELISQLSLAEALQHLSQSRERGCLWVSVNYHSSQLYVRDGFLVQAISPTREGEAVVELLRSTDTQGHIWFPHEKPAAENLKMGLMSIALQVAMGKDQRSSPSKTASLSSARPRKSLARFYLIEEARWNRFFLAPDICVLGRTKECDLMINHPSISRRHCLFNHVRQGLLVRDLGSTNGTWINGLPAGSNTYARAGDAIYFGNYKTRLYLEA